ncbi:uncharacterized protein [Macrobrachium rosenbergii]|uniref:uncharacterized protein n=1 Tax=Macrobrachium rosenbergii TaxID=79674 RepID=UPI0034D71260
MAVAVYHRLFFILKSKRQARLNGSITAEELDAAGKAVIRYIQKKTFSVDFFGPQEVKEGRQIRKRYGVLFTCLSTRAIHIETANSLDTSSFINALRRFVARRGNVKKIWCDNGTNFHGAEKELRKSLQEMNDDQVRAFLSKESISWTFNPPTASHMGGVWERQIRTVRKVLTPLFKEHAGQLDDESNRTLLTEVEAIVNDRPLTTVSDSPDDLQPLSPAQLLTQKSSVVMPPPGIFQKGDMYLRQRYDMFNSWLTYSGLDGEENIYQHYKRDRSGTRKSGTFKLVILSL